MEDQRRRFSERTMHKYDDVVGSLRDPLNGYAYESLDKTDTKRFDMAYQAGMRRRSTSSAPSTSSTTSESSSATSWSER